MKVLTVVGNRPQFIKAAAVSKHLRSRVDEILVHTGQHHDDHLSTVFFDELDLQQPDHYLDISGGSNTKQVGRMLPVLEELITGEVPDAVLVYGDTNSTLAGAIAASHAGIALIHVEAGMRSFDRSMPEEINRVLTDHMSSLLLCSTKQAHQNLLREGVAQEKIEVIGDVMVDIALQAAPVARGRAEILSRLGVESGGYILVTAHRCGNVDDLDRLRQLVAIITGLSRPAVFPLHPRTRLRLEEAGLIDRLHAIKDLHLVEPLGYLDFMALLLHAQAVLTDSGGLQKEAYLARKLCVTLRPSTEWIETVETGWNVLVDLNLDLALEALDREQPREHPELYGDGSAGKRVVEAIECKLLVSLPELQRLTN